MLQVQSKGRRSREELKKYSMQATALSLVITSVSRNSCGFGREQETRSAKEEDEKRRKTEEMKNRRITTMDEWKKQRYAREQDKMYISVHSDRGKPILNFTIACY